MRACVRVCVRAVRVTHLCSIYCIHVIRNTGVRTNVRICLYMSLYDVCICKFNINYLQCSRMC